MPIFSFISKLFGKTNSITSSFLDEQEVVDKTLFSTLLDLNDSTILCFNKQSGYIVANGAFFQLFGFKNIGDFRNRYGSIREVFLCESEEIFTEDDKSWMDYIRTHNSAKSLMSNIEALLDLSQMQSGRLSLNNVEFSLIDEIKELVIFFMEEGYEKALHVGFFIDPKIPKMLEGDVHKIRQIINSLVQNAIKFTARDGKIIVEMKLPFISSDQPNQRLGVGLSLSYGLVALLGGELKIQSKDGIGSIFSFSLDFERYGGHSFAMIPHKNVKVLLLDESKIDDANLLTTYLRPFSMGATKVNISNKEHLVKSGHITRNKLDLILNKYLLEEMV